MENKRKQGLFILLSLGLFLFLMSAFVLFFMSGIEIAVLSPKGLIALKERNLLLFSTLVMLIVVVPVFILTFFIIWRYRKSNSQAKYQPEFKQNLLAESIWWGLPCLIVIVLAVLAWKSSHELDPFKPIYSDKKPLRIQAIALQWKWLFIYPEQKIATVNFLQIPEKTPIIFDVTADAPMNSFWIPQLGGQIYAMPGMKSQLHLIAHEPGNFYGASANLSGKGFAGMHFMTKASSEEEFQTWVQSLQQSPKALDLEKYKLLAAPSVDNPIDSFLLQEEGLYDWIVMQYMMPMPMQERK